ncbi:hypothetical protein JCM19046_5105 [Bacillus sp. JCM 19046]|nr:hypothetical protein JCM19045_3 [Bacillus sp. JCM 19045]GAF20373.1 hypothetical protein JCM19046_5105 [Bacillus sp. JCM 19046]
MIIEDELLNQLINGVAIKVMETIPEEWDKFYLYGEVLEGSQTFRFYYYPLNQDEPVYCHNIPELFTMSRQEYIEHRHALLDTMQELNDVFAANDQERWTNFTMIVDKTGKMKMDFSYEDLSDTSPTAQSAIWEYEHLGLMPKSDLGREFLDDYLEKKEKEGNG